MGYNSVDLSFIEQGDQLGEEIASLWSLWKSQRAQAEARWKETQQFVYATSTRETSNAGVGGDDGEGWAHSTHIPKITQLRDNLIANYQAALFPNDDYLKFEGMDDEAVSLEKRQAVEAYLRTKHKLSDFEPEVSRLVEDWVDYGNCFAQVYFTRETHEDPDTGNEGLSYIGPRVRRISPFDIVFNPIAESFAKTPKIIRSIYSLGDLAREIEESPDGAYFKEVFDKIVDNREKVRGIGQDVFDKYSQMSFDGFGSVYAYMTSGYVEVLDFYGDIYDIEGKTLLKNHIVTVVDRKFVIRKQAIKTWTGRPHLYHAGWRKRPDNLWAMGPLDNLVGMQYYINHLENARADAFDEMIFPDLVIQGEVQVVQEEGSPKKTYIVPEAGQGAVSYLAPDTNVLNADFQIQRKEQQMEEYAGAPKEAMGIRSPGEKTAYEVQQLTTAASRLFQHKITEFERTFLEPIVNAEIEVARRNLDVMDVISIIDNDTGAVEFLNITKEDITANGKIVPIGARHFAQRQQKIQELTQAFQLIESTGMAQHIPSHKQVRALLSELGFDKYDLFEPFGRIAEQMQAQRLMNAAQDTVQSEAMIGPPMPEEPPIE